MMTENEKMRFYRESMGWSRQKLSRLICLSDVYIKKIEDAQRAVSANYRARMRALMQKHSKDVGERIQAFKEVLR